MNKQKINEAMARCDGIQGTIYADSMQYVNGPFTGSIPAYTESHDAVQRVIDGLEFPVGLVYWNNLLAIRHRDSTSIWEASCIQKCEAVIKAKGLWTKEMEAGR